MIKYFNILAFTFLTITFSYAGNPDAELIKYDVRCKIEKGILCREYSYLIQINNRLGDKYAHIRVSGSKQVSFSPEAGRLIFCKVFFFFIKVIKPDKIYIGGAGGKSGFNELVIL